MTTKTLCLIVGACLLSAIAAASRRRHTHRSQAPATTMTVPTRLLGCAGSGR